MIELLGRARLQRFRNLEPMPTYPCRIWLLRLGASAKSVCAMHLILIKPMTDILCLSFRVNAPSKEHMCKSVVMENTRCTHEDISGIYRAGFHRNIDRLNQYVLIRSQLFKILLCYHSGRRSIDRCLCEADHSIDFNLSSMSNLSTLRKCWTFAEAWKTRRLVKSTTIFD